MATTYTTVNSTVNQDKIEKLKALEEQLRHAQAAHQRELNMISTAQRLECLTSGRDIDDPYSFSDIKVFEQRAKRIFTKICAIKAEISQIKSGATQTQST